jgi:DNA repair protein RadC
MEINPMNKPLKIHSETPAVYLAAPADDPALVENQKIAQALAVLKSRLRRFGQTYTNPDATQAYLVLRLASQEREVFGCLWLNNQHQLIEDEELFYGTIDGAPVYPREIVKACLNRNAAAVLLYHNHPSGVCAPSEADRRITDKLKQTLGLIDVRVLDHIIVAGLETYSFACHGLL